MGHPLSATVLCPLPSDAFPWPLPVRAQPRILPIPMVLHRLCRQGKAPENALGTLISDQDEQDPQEGFIFLLKCIYMEGRGIMVVYQLANRCLGR